MKNILKSNGHTLTQDDEQKPPKIMEIIEEEEEEKDDKKQSSTITDEFIAINNVEIKFLPLNIFNDICDKTKYQNYFDIITISNTGSNVVNGHDKLLNKILKNQNGLVIFETAKNLIELNHEQINSYSHKIRTIAKSNDFNEINEPLNNSSKFENFDFIKFIN
jgi:hypothetical protein